MKRRGAMLLLVAAAALAHAHGAHEHGRPQETSLSAPLPASTSAHAHQHLASPSDGQDDAVHGEGGHGLADHAGGHDHPAAHAGGHDHSVAAKTVWDESRYSVPYSYAVLDASGEGGRPGALWTHIGMETLAWFVALPIGAPCSISGPR